MSTRHGAVSLRGGLPLMNLQHNRVWQRVFRTRAEDSLPHVVTHQRLYIVPTRRGWAFLLALLLMLVAAINYALSLGYALCFLLTGLFAASLLHTYRNLAGLSIERIDGGDTFAGEPLEFSVMLANQQPHARHGIRISSSDGVDTRIRVDAEHTLRATLSLPTTARGRHWLGRLTLQSDWPLGLWTCWSYLHVPVQGLAFPQPENDPPPLPSCIEERDGNRISPARQGDVSGLRDYVPGDSIGSIAWKSAARGLGLQVRSFDAETGPSQILLNLMNAGHNQLEAQLSRLCAWVLHAEEQQTDYALHLPGEQLEAAHGREQRQRALRALALHGKL